MKSDTWKPSKLIPLTGGLWGLSLVGGLAASWVWWVRSTDVVSFGTYAYGVLTGLPWPSLLMLSVVSLVSALAISLTSRRLLSGGRDPKAVIGCLLVVSMFFGGNAGLWVFASPSPPSGSPASCTYDVYLVANTPTVWSQKTHSIVVQQTNGDLGALIDALPQSNQVICVSAGSFHLDSPIVVVGQRNVTLDFSPDAVMSASAPIRLVKIIGSEGVTLSGGKWIGAGYGNQSNIEVQRGSSNVVVEGVDSSNAARDGILLWNASAPSVQISILDNYLHGNGRWGAQDYSRTLADSFNVLISGNRAEDNSVGGFNTNGAGGVHIVGNIVRNAVGTSPGVIGIGVMNAANDSVTNNHVQNMGEYGIQVFYSNHTLVANNYSGFNAGRSDQSGITNDHGFYNTIVNNTAVSNGLAGIHVERSWYDTISGNNATDNGRFGIEFYHGTLAATAYETVVGNTCNRNKQAGIIFNSGLDSIVSSNTCLDNSGPGVYLYNDQGQVGCSGNVIANNTLGDDRAAAARTQTYGVLTVNAADDNLVQGNILFGNTLANLSLAGTSNTVLGNVGSP